MTTSGRAAILPTAIVCLLAVASVFATGPTFRADYRFKGTRLTGFTPLGQADWKVENGELVGTPKDAAGGWLLVDGKAFQDAQIYADVKCAGGCKSGFILRAEKTPEGGMKGILMSLTDGDLVPYLVRIDAKGREISRDPLPAPPPGRGGSGAGGRGAAVPGAGAAPAGITQQGVTGSGPAPALSPEIAAQLPANLAKRPSGAFVPGDYNSAEVLLTENSVQPKFNGGALGGTGQRNIPAADADGYGQIGLYVGGTGAARFRDFMYKDILDHTWGTEEVSRNYRAIRVDPHYYSWSPAVADFNHDGIMDVAAGPFYYLGPDFKVGKQIYKPTSYNPTSEWPIAAMVSLAYDFTGDGWPDILQMSGNAGNGTGTLVREPERRLPPLGEVCGAVAGGE